MKDMSTTENIEGTEKRERRGERLQGIPLERDNPAPGGTYLPRGKVPRLPPMLIGAGLEVYRQKFQASEILE